MDNLEQEGILTCLLVDVFTWRNGSGNCARAEFSRLGAANWVLVIVPTQVGIRPVFLAAETLPPTPARDDENGYV